MSSAKALFRVFHSLYFAVIITHCIRYLVFKTAVYL